MSVYNYLKSHSEQAGGKLYWLKSQENNTLSEKQKEWKPNSKQSDTWNMQSSGKIMRCINNSVTHRTFDSMFLSEPSTLKRV